MGEIYSGVDKINAGSRKKVIADCFKLLYAEKLLRTKCDKRLVFIDEKIMKVFTGDSWVSKAISAFGIETSVYPISDESLN
ncbi:MAG TPA: hypothetical protein VGB44_09430 [Flavobacterium sp.]|jgi:hypothetical protein